MQFPGYFFGKKEGRGGGEQLLSRILGKMTRRDYAREATSSRRDVVFFERCSLLDDDLRRLVAKVFVPEVQLGDIDIEVLDDV